MNMLIRRQPPRGPTLRPLIYAAGRMSGCDSCKTDWRNGIAGFPGLYDLSTGIDAGPKTVVDCGYFRYGGPYIIASQNTGGHTLGHAGWPNVPASLTDR